MKTYVLYHANCYDGFGAALAARLGLPESAEAQYIPVSYGGGLPPMQDEARIYILDFSYPPSVLHDMAEVHPDRSITLLDHHKTAAEDLKGWTHPQVELIFDLDESGATLTWEYFHGGRLPRFFAYLRDRDLWQFELPRSREVSVALRAYPFDFAVWGGFLEHGMILRLQQEGVICLRYQNQLVAEQCRCVTWVNLGEHTIPCVNATTCFSECGEYLCLQYPEAPFAAYFLVRNDGRVQWGLRSRQGFDVSAVARQYGGGGHAAAAGFITDTMLPRGQSR